MQRQRALVGFTAALGLVSASSRNVVPPGGEEQQPRDFHNLFVIIVVGLVFAWMAKVLYQLFRAADLNARLSHSQSLQLEGMSVYAPDFQVLIRQHFNQILRIRRTVPPKLVSRQALSVHLHPDSLAVWSGEGSGNRAGPLFGVQFTVDALAPCRVKLFWGVSILACNEFVQRRHHGSHVNSETSSRWGSGRASHSNSRVAVATSDTSVGRGRRWPRPASSAQESTRSLLEMEEMSGGAAPRVCASEENQNIFAPDQYTEVARDFFLPAGNAQRYCTPAGDLIDPSQLSFDVSASWLREGQAADNSARVPLAIVVVAQRRPQELGTVQSRPVMEVHGQLTLVKFRRGEVGGPRAPEVIRQLTFGERYATHEVQGVFGFEDEGDSECMICYSRPKNVMLLPCRHCSVCHPCLRSLRDEKCPLCRSVFSSYVTFPIDKAPLATSGAPQSGMLPQHLATSGEASSAEVTVEESCCTAPAAGESAAAASQHSGTNLCNASNSQGIGGGGSGTAGSGTGTATAGVAAVVPMPVPQDSPRGSNAGSTHSAAGSASGSLEPVRQARDLQLGRPRGLAPASRTTAQGLRNSGRARFTDRADTATSHEGAGEETNILISDSGADAV